MSCLLAAAIVHLLGACPCGCLDGNLWLQQIRAIVAASAGDVGEQPVEVDHQCDDDSLTWLAGDGSPAGVHSAVAVAVAAVAPGAAVDVAGAPVVSASDTRPPAAPSGISARRLRASLQIFLI
ncbi:MAG: hypothetical protein CMJ58_28170 [Planctomycetaceae bacterium]|nr:hypothetical protein [Planctomycetaceae bacterium]